MDRIDQSTTKSTLPPVWKILVIDDDEEDFFIARGMLKEAKGQRFAVQWASSYEAGRAELEQNHYDAVLIDYDLGGAHSGVELIREVNALGYPSPLILFTGRGSYEVDVEAMQAGATMYLTKGEVSPLLLERSIRYAVEMKQKEQSLRASEAQLLEREASLRSHEAQLLESETKFRKVFEIGAIGADFWDEDGSILEVNDALLNIIGYTRQDFEQGRINWMTITPPEYRAADMAMVARMKAGLPPESVEKELIRKDGTRIPVMVTGSSLGFLPNGKMYGVAFCLDLSKRKQVERDLQESNTMLLKSSIALRESEAQVRNQYEELSQIYQYAPVGLFTLDREYRFLRINDRMAEINGFPVADHIGRRLDEIVPDLAEALKEVYRPVFERAEPALSVEIHGITRKDPHKERTWLCNYFPLKSEAGQVAGLIGAVLEVTERRTAEEALRQSRALLHAIIDNASAAIFAKDLQGRFILSNRYHAALLGQSPKEMIGKTDADFQEAAPLAGEYLSNDQKVAALGQPIEFEEIAPGPDGSPHTYLSVKFPLRDPNGIIYGICGISTDITERKRMEEELRESERVRREANDRFRVALSAAPITIYTTDCDLRITWMHDFHPEFNMEQVIGLRLDQLLPGEYGKLVMDIQKNVIATGQAQQGEIETWADGQPFDYTYYIDPIRDAAGKMTGLACAGFEITRRKQAEKALAEREDMLEMALTSANVGAWTWDLLSNVQIWSDDFYRIYGYQPGEVEASGKASFDRIHPEDRSAVEHSVKEAISSGKTIELVHRIIWPDGSLHWIRGLSRIYFDANGKPYRMAGIILDVTRQKQEEDMLARYADQLARSNQDLEQFAYVASHDLQEPLRKIILFGEGLRKKAQNILDDEAMDYVDRMQNAAQRMQTMINGLLELSRVNKHDAQFQVVHTREVVVEAVSDLEARIHSVGGQVKIGELPDIVADELQLRQLFQNLIGNAIKFHRPGVPPVVSVSGQIDRSKQPAMVEIQIADNGIGFDQDQTAQIFQPFQRLYGRSEYEGTGLGLAICRKIVERHHGKITARSSPGEGSTFLVTLPLTPPKAAKE